MPYISPKAREIFIGVLNEFGAVLEDQGLPLTPGELNYLITRIVFMTLPRDPDYSDYSRVRGVLADVSSEFYRRLMIPYEDYKHAVNGDVYGRIPK